MAAPTRRFAFTLCFIAAALSSATTPARSGSISASCHVLQDTLIRQLTPTVSYNTYSKGWAHSAVGGIAGLWVETLLRFDLSTCLPAHARVSGASLHLYVTNPSNYPFEPAALDQALIAGAAGLAPQ